MLGIRRLAPDDHTAHAEIAEDRRQSLARRDGHDRKREQLGWCSGDAADPGPSRSGASRDEPRCASRPAATGAGSPVNAAARVSRTVARLVVEILDADPGHRAECQPIAEHEIRPVIVDVDLDGPRVAGNEHGLADPLEMSADGVEVEALARGGPGAGTSSRSRNPRRHGPPGRTTRRASRPARPRVSGACPIMYSSAPWKRR